MRYHVITRPFTGINQAAAWKITALFFFFLLSIPQSQANNTHPETLIKSAATEMIDALNNNLEEIKKDPDIVKKLVEKIILPNLDIITASKWAMGKYWRRADKKQKIEFIKSFRTLLVRFYSSALAEYLDSSGKKLDQNLFTYYPLRGSLDTKDVTIRSVLNVDKGEPIPVNYHMHLTRKGWKIYDVTIEGISMITTYKNNFSTELKQKGIDGLITSLKEKNRQLASNHVTDKKAK